MAKSPIPSNSDGAPGDANASGELRRTELLHHCVALGLFIPALYFTVWFFLTNAPLPKVFLALIKPYSFAGGTMDWAMLGWSVGSIVVFTILGWFFLESQEVYLPGSATAALAFLLGLGLVGVLYEWLAIAQILRAPYVFLAPAVLLCILWPLAARATEKKTETGEGGSGGATKQAARRELAQDYELNSRIAPGTPSQRAFQFVATSIIAVISLLTFYHAVLYPEVYWDSLILYLGYARKMFYQQGVVVKMVGQVGDGLGANYPHLYEFLGAGITSAAGRWSSLPQQLLAPVAGLATTILVYHTALRLTRHVNFSLAITLLYRSIPLGIVYDQYASNYAITILFTAAFLYVALYYVETGLRAYFLLATLLVALAMHVNYLMGILWLPWGLMVLGAHLLMPSAKEREDVERERQRAMAKDTRLMGPGPDDEADADEEAPPPWTFHPVRQRLPEFLRSPYFLTVLICCVALASTWHIRNWIVTGNPVYAFFYEVFGGKNINAEVMESAAVEWGMNGAGIGRVGDTLGERIRNSWQFFVIAPQPWRLQPFFPGFVWASTLVLLARIIAPRLASLRPGRRRAGFEDFGARFGFIALALGLALFAFHYMLATFYLYQIICVLPVFACLACFSFPYWQRSFWRYCFGALALTIGLVPGVAMALMGFKVLGPVRVSGSEAESPLDLLAFRHPLPDPEMFYSWRFGEDAAMWSYINERLAGQKILTHENRHLVFEPTIELIHIDDWEIQELWNLQSEEQKIHELKKMGILYYLKVPNEKSHPINARMGTDHWPVLGLVETQRQHGGNVLYRLK